MRRIFSSLLLAAAFSLAVPPGDGPTLAQTPPRALCPITGPMSDDQFHEHVACLARGIVIVWEENIREAVAITPGVPGVRTDLRLEVVKGCDLIPLHDPSGIRIEWPHLLTYYTLYFQQALAFYVMDLAGILTPEGVVDFFEREMQAKLLEHRVRCPGLASMHQTGRIPDQLPSVVDGRFTQAQYEAQRRSIIASPASDELQAYLAIGPTMFVILHEAGHAAFHPRGTTNSLDDEMAADQYAAAVFRANGIPATIGLGLHQMIYQNSDHGSRTGLDCRLRRLAAEDSIPEDFARKFGAAAAQRLEQLRLFYVAHYGATCGP